MFSDQPLVTVYIPTYNRLELLKRAVKSVQDQTYQNLEVIIVDDCSTDGTQEYLIQLVAEDQRVRYFFKEKNSGACVSRNIAIENAKGEFITGLDDDDYFSNDRIEKFIKSWSEDFVFIYSSYIVKRKKKTYKQGVLLCKGRIELNDILAHNYVGNQIFCKTQSLRNVKGFDEKLKMWQDYDCWYRLLKMSGKKAKLIRVHTYIIDMDHDYSRISEAKINKIRETYVYFIDKHKLSIKEIILLSKNMIYYDDKSYFLETLFKLFLLKNILSLKSFVLSIKRFFNV